VRILVTGGAGFIGSNLCSMLSARGITTTAIDAFRPHGAVGARAAETLRYRREVLLARTHLIEVDMLDKALLRDVLVELQPDCIIHLAGLAIVSAAESNRDAAAADILQSTINLFEAVRLSPHCARVVHISSSMVYGHFAGAIVGEDARLAPVNIYGELKLAAEVVARTYLAATSVESVIVRPSAVYGPGEVSRRVVQTFCESALLGSPITIKGGNSELLDFTYVGDLCHGLHLAATVPAAAGETFNMTGGQPHSLTDLVSCIRRHFPEMESYSEQRDAFRPKRGALDIGKARRLLGYAPTTKLASGIAHYIAHLSEHPSASAQPEPILGVG